jgi:hypothetical protein
MEKIDARKGALMMRGSRHALDAAAVGFAVGGGGAAGLSPAKRVLRLACTRCAN